MRTLAQMPNILVVDDNPGVTRSLAAVLHRAGYAAETCHSGIEALRRIEQSRPHAVLVDIHLPDISGLVLSQQLRQKLGPDTPIIVVSGDASMEVINSLSHVGATHFYRKPINSGDLVARLRELVA